MRWREKYNNPLDQRIIKKFLLFPCTIGEETRWLERVVIVQSWERAFHNGLIMSLYYRWVNIGFKDFEDQFFTSPNLPCEMDYNKNKNNPPRRI